MPSTRDEVRHSLLAWLEARAAQAPDQVGLQFADQDVRFGQMRDDVRSVAAGLAELGVHAGDRVVIYMDNSYDFVQAWLAALSLGALAVPINLGYRGEFLRHQVADAGAAIVITDAEHVLAVLDVASACPELATIVISGEWPTEDDAGAVQPTLVPFEVVRQSAPQGPLGEYPPEHPATILYTSGTTGLSKGVVLSHGYLETVGRTLVDGMAITENDVYFNPLPLFHLGGVLTLLVTLQVGCVGVITRHFSVSETWEQVRRCGATIVAFVGPMVQMLYSLPADPADVELPLRVMSCAPVPAGLEESLQKRYGCQLFTGYGLTEAFPLVIGLPGQPLPVGASGRRNERFDIRLVNEDDSDVTPGQPGEIVCRPREQHVMFDGYFNNPSATDASIRDGWFHTGDLCRQDADGFFYFVDRQKDAIRRRGENISSLELEAAIRSHPAVADVAVHGVPSPLGEDDVKALVVLASPGAATFEELDTFFNDHLPKFAVPRYVEFVEQIPRNQVARVLKYQLRDRGITPETWDREAALPAR